MSQSERNTGFLSVDSDYNFDLYLDTMYIASRSFSNLALPPGNYILRAYDANDLSWQSRGFTRQVQILPGEHVKLTFDQQQAIHLYSKPFGSEVYLNNELLGKTPLVVTNPITNTEKLTLKKTGFQEFNLFVNNNQKEYLVELKRKDDINQTLVFRAVPDKKHISWLREGLVVTSLVSSWASFFFKREADKNYEKYLRTADPFQMVTSFRKTQDFDRYAEIALGVSLVSLGTYLFLLLID